MNTSTAMHLKVQRSRFAHHFLAALAGFLPTLFQLIKPSGPAPRAAPAPADAVREAARVREMADSYANTDPGFAADLYAAADRHEMLASR